MRFLTKLAALFAAWTLLSAQVLFLGNNGIFQLVPAGSISGLTSRIILTGNASFYVATTGNDSNPCTAVGAPCLTIQRALDLIESSYDLAGFTATVNIADGTYTSRTNITQQWTGKGLNGASNQCPVFLVGNAATPANVLISTGADVSFFVSRSCINMSGMKVTASGANSIQIIDQARVVFSGPMDMGTSAGNHFTLVRGGDLITGTYTISGNAVAHFNIGQNSFVATGANSVTFTTNPTVFTSGYVACSLAGTINFNQSFVNFAFATGPKYNMTTNCVAAGTSAGNSIPGVVAGSVLASGAQLP